MASTYFYSQSYKVSEYQIKLKRGTSIYPVEFPNDSELTLEDKLLLSHNAQVLSRDCKDDKQYIFLLLFWVTEYTSN